MKILEVSPKGNREFVMRKPIYNWITNYWRLTGLVVSKISLYDFYKGLPYKLRKQIKTKKVNKNLHTGAKIKFMVLDGFSSQ